VYEYTQSSIKTRLKNFKQTKEPYTALHALYFIILNCRYKITSRCRYKITSNIRHLQNNIYLNLIDWQ